MTLTNNDKVIIAYTEVMNFMNDMEKNKNISREHLGRTFSQLFVLLQQHWFPTVNPGKAQQQIEEADILRSQMRALLTEAILAANKMTESMMGGTMESERVANDPNVTVDENGIIDSIIQFHDDAVKAFTRNEAVNLITNQAMKCVGIKNRLEKNDVERLVTQRLEEYAKKN